MIKTLVIASASAALLGGAAASHTVHQKGKEFSTKTLEIKAGESVVFRNDDPIPHNVYSTSKGFEFNSKLQQPGESMSHKFDRTGTAEVKCAIHPAMKLKVVVK